MPVATEPCNNHVHEPRYTVGWGRGWIDLDIVSRGEEGNGFTVRIRLWCTLLAVVDVARCIEWRVESSRGEENRREKLKNRINIYIYVYVMYICICKSENKEGRRSKKRGKRREKGGTNETEKAKE